MNLVRKLGKFLCVLLIAATDLVAIPTQATATTGGCYGASCNGLDPSGRCDDGITVAAKNVRDGFLQLRYSRSCKANWGRYTPWRRNADSYASSNPPIQLFARVTAWNPGGVSYDLAHAYPGPDNYGSSWSQMVDGTKTACTGVEVYTSSENWSSGIGGAEAPLDWEEKVWQWGPCY